MFCVSCGKEVNSYIPICKECALKVLLEEKENEKTSPILKSIEDYAVDFSPMEEQERPSQSTLKPDVSNAPVKEKDTEDDNSTSMTVVAFFIIGIIIIIITALASNN